MSGWKGFDQFQWVGEFLSYHGPNPATEQEGFAISIYKWRHVAEGARELTGEDGIELFDGNTETCGLCLLYVSEDCLSCPIWEKTGLPMCGKTPYAGWVGVRRKMRYGAQYEAAQAELMFLEDLWLELYGTEFPKEEA
jgi:hypothetical protein